MEVLLISSVTFTFLLLVIRLFNSGTITYFFYVWNIILAIIPLFISRRLLLQRKMHAKSWGIIVGWLLFFPNSFYILTDLFHYTERPPVPKWFDLLIVTSAAWNGLILGVCSLMQVEMFLLRFWKEAKVRLFVMTSLLLCSYGIYIGRFLRFNSWDIVCDPINLFLASAERILFPHQHTRTWGFTILFSVLLILVYYTVRKIAVHQQTKQLGIREL